MRMRWSQRAGQLRPLEEAPVDDHDGIGGRLHRCLPDLRVGGQVDDPGAVAAVAARAERDQHELGQSGEVVGVLVVAIGREPAAAVAMLAVVVEAVHRQVDRRPAQLGYRGGQLAGKDRFAGGGHAVDGNAGWMARVAVAHHGRNVGDHQGASARLGHPDRIRRR
jgi:hypothetical protein